MNSPTHSEDEAKDYGINFKWIVGWTNRTVAYAVCYVRSATEQRGLHMLVGSGDEAKVYLNESQVYKSTVGRPWIADQDEVPDITLRAGVNVLVFKVLNELAFWKGSIRFTDAEGNPAKGLTVTLAPNREKP